jgi:hypothetical protein
MKQEKKKKLSKCLKPVLRICKYIDNTGTPIFNYVDMDDAPSPKGSLSSQMSGYWGKETYRLGLLPISLTGKYLPVRFIEDYVVPNRSLDNIEQVSKFEEDGSIISTLNTIISGPHEKVNYNSEEEKWQYNVNIDSLLVSVDITDIIDNISGFCIVRAVRDKGIISEGFIDPIHKLRHWNGTATEELKNFYRCAYFNIRNTPYTGNPLWTSNVFIETLLKKYYYINPEVQMGKETFEEGDTMKLIRKYRGASSKIRNNDYIVQTEAPYFPRDGSIGTNKRFYLRCFKAYKEYTLADDNTEPISIKSLSTVDVGDKDFDVDTEEENFYNYAPGSAISYIDAGTRKGLFQQDPASKAALIEIDYDRKWFTGFKADGTDKLPETVYVTEHRRGTSVYSTDNNLGSAEYIFTGHYQKVDSEFKASIKNGEKYIANNIQIFGGDTHINLYGIARVLPDGMHYPVDSSINMSIHSYGDYVIVPLQSRYNSSSVIDRNGQLDNIGPKDGTSICSNKFREFYIGDDGEAPLYFDLEINYFESDEYTDRGFLDSARIKFPGLAPFASENNQFLNRIRYSNKKQTGYAIDEFIIFPAINYYDIPGDNGFITNIRGKGSKLFVWQESAIGYIPINERALTSAGQGETIELGIGGLFERFDSINETSSISLGIDYEHESLIWNFVND